MKSARETAVVKGMRGRRVVNMKLRNIVWRMYVSYIDVVRVGGS
jgi:hypothetical protein